MVSLVALLAATVPALAEAPGLAADVTITAALPPPPPPVVVPPRDLTLAEQDSVRQALAAYREGDIAGGDAHAALIDSHAGRLAVEWAAIRAVRTRLGFRRLAAHVRTHPGMAGTDWTRRRAEEALLAERKPAVQVLAFHADLPPLTQQGRIALSRALVDTGDREAATALARETFADPSLPRALEATLLRDFPEALGRAEVAGRAHRLILRGRIADGVRLATSLGIDDAKLAAVLAQAAGKGENPAVLAAVPEHLRSGAAFRLAEARLLRRAGRTEAAKLAMLAAPRDAAALVDPDEWWLERRALVRHLLDAGDPVAAYRIAAEHQAEASQRRIDAEFHAGWVALRHLGFADTAAMHFDRLLELAETPISRSRGAYWRARAAEAGARGPEAAEFHRLAALYPTTFHGQLSVAALGEASLALRDPAPTAAEQEAFSARVDVQAIELLLGAGERDLAEPLLVDLARILTDPGEVAALMALVAGLSDAPFQLTVAKLAAQRGFAVDVHAFPTFGIPAFAKREGSAEPAMVYAIARQESAFRPDAISGANARGLMQMLPSTAARTARRMGLPFHPARLTAEPAFNATLGAYHVGELLAETRGSLVMAIAAYNAGGPRVSQWAKAAGDPRKGEIDIIDWIERIPIYETRNYVHRVMENLQVYRSRFAGNRSALLLRQDMATGLR
jgi:soluble lytic murein transglycosylase